MKNDKKVLTKPFIIISILAILLVGFFVVYITCEKAKRTYHVGRTYKGKYIDNGENYNKIMHNRYEYQIEE